MNFLSVLLRRKPAAPLPHSNPGVWPKGQPLGVLRRKTPGDDRRSSPCSGFRLVSGLPVPVLVTDGKEVL